MLLGKVWINQHLAELRTSAAEILGGLARAQQVRGVPDCALRQELRLMLEQRFVADVAILVGLAVATAFRIGHRCVPDPPPARDRSGDLGRRRHLFSLPFVERQWAIISVATSRKASSAFCCTAPRVSPV